MTFSKRLRRLQPWCSKCGSVNDLTVDHIIPVVHRPDLEFDVSNCDVLCRSCNGRKDALTRGDTPPDARPHPSAKAQKLLHLQMIVNKDAGDAS
ncbi:HNH endonuclease [Tomitella fengzijianii]|uniref:HNH endonuclease n=1 Tax=Tomitella fengzijianii TaxID=2597660 RepID=UPI0022A7F3C6|nr:HNH endonuclease [Tomitella fengzijianii]